MWENLLKPLSGLFLGPRRLKRVGLLGVNLGDDPDTTGAVYGQLAGAFYGAAGIPEEWRTCIAHREMIERLADAIFEKRMK
jgi:ADP-ribosylglycohydrolase